MMNSVYHERISWDMTTSGRELKFDGRVIDEGNLEVQAFTPVIKKVTVIVGLNEDGTEMLDPRAGQRLAGFI